jgi:hypothetical protein
MSLPVAAPVSSRSSDEIVTHLILSLPRVHVFTLSDGQKSPLTQGTLKVLNAPNLHKSPSAKDDEIYLLSLDSFTFALHLAVPVLELAKGSWIFPSKSSDCYGILVELKEDQQGKQIEGSEPFISEEELELFVLILQQNCTYKRTGHEVSIGSIENKPDKVVGLANSLADKIDQHAPTVAKHIESGSLKLAQLVSAGGLALKSRLKPNDKPAQISEQTKERLKKAKTASGIAVKVSSALVKGAIATAAALAGQITEAVNHSELGAKLNSNPSPRLEAAKNVTKSTLLAVSAVSSSLVTGGLAVLGSLAHSTSEVVAHKYGEETGAAAHQVGDVVVNLAKAGTNMSQVGVAAIVKRSVKQAATEICDDEEKEKKDEESLSDSLQSVMAMGAAAQFMTGTK